LLFYVCNRNGLMCNSQDSTAIKQNTQMQQYHTFSLPDGPSFRMVSVRGTGDGHFTMGSPKDEPGRFEDRESQHPVALSDFMLAEFAVTQALWTAIIGENPSSSKGAQRPVENVSWFNAAVFCNALNKKLHKNPCYLDEKDQVFGWDEKKKGWQLPNEGTVRCAFIPDSFRLPTEAEWEYAARGGLFSNVLQDPPERDYWYAGSDKLEQVGWFAGNSDRQTHDVGLLLPNALGLYDMSGNVLEWCNDWYDAYPKQKEKDPKGSEKGADRVLRGGDWFNGSQYCRSACRNSSEPVNRGFNVGFRLALQ